MKKIELPALRCVPSAVAARKTRKRLGWREFKRVRETVEKLVQNLSFSKGSRRAAASDVVHASMVRPFRAFGAESLPLAPADCQQTGRHGTVLF